MLGDPMQHTGLCVGLSTLVGMKLCRSKSCSCSHFAQKTLNSSGFYSKLLAVVLVPVLTQTYSPSTATCSEYNPLSRQQCQKLIAEFLIRITHLSETSEAFPGSWHARE